MIAPRRITSTILATTLLASLGTLFAEPASAAPPVTVDDEISMWAGGVATVDVLANDSDPDGDELVVCRLAEAPEDAPYFTGLVDDEIMVFVLGEVTEPITITYYACDYESLVPGTLTVTVKTAEPIKVTKLDKPGVLRVTNPNDRQVRFLWGNAKERRPDGRVQVPAHDSVFVRVHRHQIIWAALLGRFSVVGVGRVRDIELPKDDRGTAALRQRGQLPVWPAGVTELSRISR